MQGNQKVIDALNGLLAGELAARDQYFIHSRMFDDWGLSKLTERYEHEMEEETHHADLIIKRILFLEGTPDLNQHEAINVGADTKAIFENDLALEYKVGKALKAVVKTCEEAQDYVTRDMLESQLKDTEEDHTHWLEQQLGLIDLLGLPNYLQSQL